MPHSFKKSSSESSKSARPGGGAPRGPARVRRRREADKERSGLDVPGVSTSLDPLLRGLRARTARLADRVAPFIDQNSTIEVLKKEWGHMIP